MAQAKFEFDEGGSAFFFFFTLYTIMLLFATCGLWTEDTTDINPYANREEEEQKQLRKKREKFIYKLMVIVGWLIFALLVYKAAHNKSDYEEYDPYEILGMDRGASKEEIKKRYRELSKTAHPDRGGDPLQYDRIAKAHQVLTSDDELRENWEKYGNPDGPSAPKFGFAFPKWMVSEEYGIWILIAYTSLFIIPFVCFCVASCCMK